MENKTDSTKAPPLHASSHLPTTRRLRWALCAVVFLVVFGGNGWNQCKRDAQETPFSRVPKGGVGNMTLSPCADGLGVDGLECGYLKYVILRLLDPVIKADVVSQCSQELLRRE
jgi:hypothetical protein